MLCTTPELQSVMAARSQGAKCAQTDPAFREDQGMVHQVLLQSQTSKAPMQEPGSDAAPVL